MACHGHPLVSLGAAEHRASSRQDLHWVAHHNPLADIEGKSDDGNDGTGQDESEKEKEKEQDKDLHVVDWDHADPRNPMNFSMTKKSLITIALGGLNFCVTFSSSILSTATGAIAQEYGVSTVVSTLGTSLFVLGFAVGPIIWGPISEYSGRRRPLLFGFFVFAIFQIPVAVAQNLHTILICRFIGCVFGSSTLAIGGGALADFWEPVRRGVAVCFVFAATFGGPTLGPVIGGFITQSHLGWRWTQWITLILSGIFGLYALIVLPETAHPIILKHKAKGVRHETGNWAAHAKAEEVQITGRTMAYNVLLRPLVMMVQEPILLMMNIYIGLVYGYLYLFFEAFPISFQEERGWNNGVGSLPFLGILIGVLLGVCIVIWNTTARFARKLKEHHAVIPEERLPPMMLGAVLLPVGLFWFAWTSNPHISWVPQVISCIPIGMGLMMIFLQGLNYIIDCYLWYANSALVSNTALRSLAGAGFPMFASAMFHNLGVPWATSLLAFLCMVLVPVPFLFFIYGERIRKMSKFSPTT